MPYSSLILLSFIYRLLFYSFEVFTFYYETQIMPFEFVFLF